MDARPGRLLLVAFHFPPDFTIGAFRPRRMAIHLARLGWTVDVLTVRPRYLDTGDPEVCRGLEAIGVHRTHALKIRRAARAAPAIAPGGTGDASTGGGAGEASTGGGAAGALPRVRQGARALASWLATRLEIPDPCSGWIPLAVASGVRLPPPDVILATAPVFSNFLVGAALAVRFRAPLVLDYRDPWNPTVRRTELPPWRQRLEAALESWCLGRARELVATTPGLAEEIRGYAGRPVRVVTNACDPERFQDVEPRAFDRPTVVYAGNLYGDRTLDPVLAAVARLRAAGRLGPAQLQILYMGRTAEAAAASAEALGVSDFLRIEGPRPSDEALAASAGATCNLSIVGAEHARLVPAKIFEHLVVGRGMLVIAPPGSDTGALLRDVAQARCIAPDDEAGLEEALLQVAAGGAAAPAAALPAHLTAESTMETLHRLLLSARRP